MNQRIIDGSHYMKYIKNQNAYLCHRAPPRLRLTPLPLLPLRKRVRSFMITTKVILFPDLIDPNNPILRGICFVFNIDVS